ncbi:carbon-nitrogen hydrolase family protein [Marimonas lutisalis]|uniref:carbon-nitrogen hydrolase family protein n=1 Tax=Marimonas lutisalis TaxID=2545756 RepID=UPI0010FA15E8|nr:carbon-nitrogen hydrolase family protein [Marimonas lutisalis]
MKIATAAYPLSWLSGWSDYEAKITQWVAEAVGQGADLLVFPEYGAMELASLSGAEAAGSVQGSIAAVGEWLEQANALFSRLSSERGVHILSPSAPLRDGDRTVNRAGLFTPSSAVGWQDKQIMTRFERDDWGIEGGGPLQLFDTALGRIGVLICYDSEFPLLAKALADAGAELILVPSCTEALEGYWRVRIGSMARALELQCVTVMSSLIGTEPRLYAVEENTGTGGIFGPPDKGFPPTGVIACGTLDQPGWTIAEINLDAIRAVRADGHVLNLAHWQEQVPRIGQVAKTRLA